MAAVRLIQSFVTQRGAVNAAARFTKAHAHYGDTYDVVRRVGPVGPTAHPWLLAQDVNPDNVIEHGGHVLWLDDNGDAPGYIWRHNYDSTDWYARSPGSRSVSLRPAGEQWVINCCSVDVHVADTAEAGMRWADAHAADGAEFAGWSTAVLRDGTALPLAILTDKTPSDEA